MKALTTLLAILLLSKLSMAASTDPSDEIKFEIIASEGCIWLDGLEVNKDFPMILSNGFLNKIHSLRLYYSTSQPTETSPWQGAEFDQSQFPPSIPDVKACGFKSGDIVRARLALLDQSGKLIYFPVPFQSVNIP